MVFSNESDFSPISRCGSNSFRAFTMSLCLPNCSKSIPVFLKDPAAMSAMISISVLRPLAVCLSFGFLKGSIRFSLPIPNRCVSFSVELTITLKAMLSRAEPEKSLSGFTENKLPPRRKANSISPASADCIHESVSLPFCFGS